ncbi:hypothetical protein AN958_02878 [Leucoagaricus sp. SymC.cos]|nr:hypothetical protein AN958_02878 [Leucoagaricus sp. SymC.cos]
MLSILVLYSYSRFLGLSLHVFLLRYAFLLAVILLLPRRTLAQVQNQTRNVTIPLDSSQIIYTPFLCDRNTTLSNPNQCNGGWSTRGVGDESIISTKGPDIAAGEVIPQMFLQFRGSALYLFTSKSSNARANITITNNGTTIAAVFESTLGLASILGLEASTATTFALTFLPTNTAQELDLTSLIITISNDALTTSLPILPSMTLPPSSSPPIFTPRSASSTQSNPSSPADTQPTPSSNTSARRSNIALAVGLTIGLGLGLTSVSAVGFWWYRKRRRRRWVRSVTTDQTSVGTGFGIGIGSRGASRADSRADSRATGNLGRSHPSSLLVGGIGSITGGLVPGNDGRSRSATPGWRSNTT